MARGCSFSEVLWTSTESPEGTAGSASLSSYRSRASIYCFLVPPVEEAESLRYLDASFESTLL